MWLEPSEQRGEREEERMGRGWGRSCRALWAMRRTWAFTCRKVGALEGCEQCNDGTRLECSQVLSHGCFRKDRWI